MIFTNFNLYNNHPGAERIVQRKLDCDGKHGDDQIPRRDGRSFAGGADGGSDGGWGDNGDGGCGFFWV